MVYAVLSFIAVVVAGIGTGWVRRYAHSRNLLDIPNERSSHHTPVPRGGGLAIVASTLIALAIGYGLGIIEGRLFAAIAGGGSAVALIGWMDDRFGLSARARIVVHAAAAAWAVFMLGSLDILHFTTMGPDAAALVAALLTAAAIVWLTNLYNFMDGIDGLAGIQGVTVAACAAVLLYFTGGSTSVTAAALIMGAACAGFLVWNWAPARIFMGDVGSSFLGFAFAVLALGSDRAGSLAAPFWILLMGVFVADAMVTLVRRAARGETWYHAHRLHAYQRAVQSGLSHARVSALAGLLNIGLALTAYLAIRFPNFATSAVAVAVGLLAMTFISIELRVPMWARATPRPRLSKRVLDRVYNHRRIVTLTAYAVLAGAAYTLAFLLRYDFAMPLDAVRTWATTLPLLLVIRVVCDHTFDLTTSRWRFVGTHDVLRLAVANLFGTTVLFLASWSPLVPVIPRSVIMMEWFLTTFFVAALWIGYRTTFEQIRQYRGGDGGSTRRALIVGAGQSGNMIAREIIRSRTGYRAVGFVDDNQAMWGSRIQGIRVHGGTTQLAEIAARTRADEVIIAIPSANPQELRKVVDTCQSTDLRFKVMPDIVQVLSGRVNLNDLRELRIEDLLGREPIALALPEIDRDLNGRTILITGAAGSIGSELARQIALYNPGTLIAFDQSETGLFFLDRELRKKHPELNLVTCVGDIVDEVAVERAFRRYAPSRVYHAAAFKHVSMMQINMREALRNNAFGTYCVANAAGRHGADKFILVSTDKAVRPTSVMGATKRLAEMVLTDLQRTYPDTSFAAVRFGNVLGSAGSVIPIFKEQIEKDEPLTVSHPEATRYFMTIPEAVQLILHAALLPEVRGRIAMLEMGDPVLISDLARNMLRLAGRPALPGTTIQFTGLRPGEKLHEELIAPDERTFPTAVPKIRLLAHPDLQMFKVMSLLGQWEHAFIRGADDEVIAGLVSVFPDLAGHIHGEVPLELRAENVPLKRKRVAGGGSGD